MQRVNRVRQGESVGEVLNINEWKAFYNGMVILKGWRRRVVRRIFSSEVGGRGRWGDDSLEGTKIWQKTMYECELETREPRRLKTDRLGWKRFIRQNK